MQLIAILEDGQTAAPAALSDDVVAVIRNTVDHYRRSGFHAPWSGYLAIENGIAVGSCAFVNAPENGEVEIAYFTFADYEGRGVATRMASELMAIARAVDPEIHLKAHTLAEDNASTSILRKLGFALAGPFEHPEDGTVWLWRRRNAGAR